MFGRFHFFLIILYYTVGNKVSEKKRKYIDFLKYKIKIYISLKI